ncbi:MAG: ATP-binding cassette domain-containing protein, partial [Alphaproteobacteria bacterium]
REITGLASHRIARLGIARSFQMPDLPPEMRLVDAVAVGAVAREDASIGEALLGPATASADRARARATALLERFALAEHAVRPCAGLPHGVRRRADVARALATTPRLLILDEPAAGLTEAEATGLARVLRGLAESGPAILVIEHNVDFLMPLADRLLCLDRGALIAAGPPRTVVADPRVAAAYFGDATAVEATA